MARRKQSLFEDLIDLAVLLPAWLSLALAFLAYLILHQYVKANPVVTGSMDDPSALVISALARTGASMGQYLLPAIFVIGAVVSFFKQRKRNALMEQTKRRGQVSALLDMTWHEFEQLVGEAFKHRGYSIRETGGHGPDGGVDLILSRNNEVFFVQCKQWRAQKVGVSIVREMYGVMAARGATGAFIVTSGSFTNEATDFANDQNIELIAGDALLAFIMPGKMSKKVTSTIDILHVAAVNPPCPACGKPMARRIAKKGKNVGNAFWGCSTFPGCKGTLPLAD